MKFVAFVSLVLISGMRFSIQPVYARIFPPPATIVSATMLDVDNNGKLDHVDIVFSDDINSASIDLSDFSVTACTFFSADYVVNDLSLPYANVISLAITEIADGMDTGVTCSVNVSGIADIYDNAVAGSVVSVDGAAPVIERIRYTDDNYNGKIDRLIVDYSEELDAETIASSDNFSIANDGDFDGTTVASSGSLEVGAELGWISLPLNEGTVMDTRDDSATFTLATNDGYSIRDVAGNTDDLIREQSLATMDDIAKPEIKSVSYEDENGDGKIDGLTMAFTETVSSGSYLWPNQLTIAEDAGFTDLQFTSDSEDLISENADSIYIPMTKSSVVSTHTDLPIVLGVGSDETGYYLLDLAGNGSGSSPENFAVTQTLDGAAPILVSSVPADEGTMRNLNANVTLKFSEDLDLETVNTSTVYFNEEGVSFIVEDAVDHSVVTLNPDGALDPLTTYYIRIVSTRGIADPAGNYVGGQTLMFTTTDGKTSGSAGYIAPTNFGSNDVIPVSEPAGEVSSELLIQL